MVANNMAFLKSVTLSIFFVFSSGCLAQTKTVEPDEVLKYASLNVLKTFSEYEKRIEYCDGIISASQSPKIDENMLSDLKVAREEAVLAVGFLHFRNYFLCEQEIRLKLAFQIGTVKSLKKELNQKAEIASELESMVSYPSKKELELEVKYLALPQKVRGYFESTIGDKPFDMVETLEMNGLMRE